VEEIGVPGKPNVGARWRGGWWYRKLREEGGIPLVKEKVGERGDIFERGRG